MNATQAARQSGKTLRQVIYALENGQLQGVLEGRKWVISQQALARWQAGQFGEPEERPAPAPTENKTTADTLAEMERRIFDAAARGDALAADRMTGAQKRLVETLTVRQELVPRHEVMTLLWQLAQSWARKADRIMEVATRAEQTGDLPEGAARWLHQDQRHVAQNIFEELQALGRQFDWWEPEELGFPGE